MRHLETVHPVLYEINTRVWMNELSRTYGKTITLDQVPGTEIDRLASLGFDLIWLMGVWKTGPLAREIAENCPEMLETCREILPDFTPDDISGSPYAIAEYKVEPSLGGPAALTEFRERLARRGIGLILDFVPNHLSVDHPWTRTHPEYFIPASENNDPGAFFTVETDTKTHRLMHGKDPHFLPWTDTVQINYRHPGAIAAMKKQLCEIAEMCDGLRCDMAMLLLADVFHKTWGEQNSGLGLVPDSYQFWPEALQTVKLNHPLFLFIAEAYWEREYDLLQMGFNYAYDKRLYDRQFANDIEGIDAHLNGSMDYLERCVHFLENHDEPRLAMAEPRERQNAMMILTSTIPGLTLFHHGQLEGRRIHYPVQLNRWTDEKPQRDVEKFYTDLLHALENPAFQKGQWIRFEVKPVWTGNQSCRRMFVHFWKNDHRGGLLVAVNLADTPSQAFAIGDLGRSETVQLTDTMSLEHYRRDCEEIRNGGLYLELQAWGYNIFTVRP